MKKAASRFYASVRAARASQRANGRRGGMKASGGAGSSTP